MGAQLGSSVAFGFGCGQALPGVLRKASMFIYNRNLAGNWQLVWPLATSGKQLPSMQIDMQVDAGHFRCSWIVCQYTSTAELQDPPSSIYGLIGWTASCVLLGRRDGDMLPGRAMVRDTARELKSSRLV